MGKREIWKSDGVGQKMIIDIFDKGSQYALGSLWTALFPELLELVKRGEELPDGRYSLVGGPENGGVAVFVSTYEPKTEETAVYESHDIMADIQAVLAGDEYLDMFPLKGGEKESMRDDGRDLVLYADKPEYAARVRLVPGMFALLLPGEAHMPCIRASSGTVRKIVVKIPVKALQVPCSR